MKPDDKWMSRSNRIDCSIQQPCAVSASNHVDKLQRPGSLMINKEMQTRRRFTEHGYNRVNMIKTSLNVSSLRVSLALTSSLISANLVRTSK